MNAAKIDPIFRVAGIQLPVPLHYELTNGESIRRDIPWFLSKYRSGVPPLPLLRSLSDWWLQWAHQREKTRKKSSKKNVFPTASICKTSQASISYPEPHSSTYKSLLLLGCKPFFMLFHTVIVLQKHYHQKLNFSNCQKQCVKSSVLCVCIVVVFYREN